MNKKDAIVFLKSNQPLPDDQSLTEEIMSTYDEIRKYFLKYKDPSCIKYLLNSFGDGSGFGVYQLIENVIIQFSKEEVLPHLKEALVSKYRGVRYWCSQISASFPDDDLIEPLMELLDETDQDIRIMSAIALVAIGGDQVKKKFEGLLAIEKDEDMIEVFEEYLEGD